jgi:hypothetical protein
VPIFTTMTNDEFWAVAMGDGGESEGVFLLRDDEDEHERDDNTKTISYLVLGNNNKGSAPITLRLRPLPATDGVWSPVGADAWYASALLACVLLCDDESWQKEADLVPFSHPLAAVLSTEYPTRAGSWKTILELGSGAVGLSGFVCALALERKLAFLQENYTESLPSQPSWKVLLTDNDLPVLEQLQSNLDENRAKLAVSKNCVVTVEVAAWDWKDDQPSNGLLPNDDVVLVIGSELVYTRETAEACVDLLVRLVSQYPHAMILIVQVSDRYGWWDIVVPTLQKGNISVDSIPLSSEIHDMAAKMIHMGGTLNRDAYGAFCIHR